MKSRDKFILVGSFLATSLIGASIVFTFWYAQNQRLAAIRSIVFVGMMGVIHWLAFRLYSSQPAVAPGQNGQSPAEIPLNQAPQDTSFFTTLAPAYGPVVKSAVIQHVLFLILSALILDFGVTLRSCCVTVIAHWAAILLVVLRRPIAPSKIDVFVVKFGFFACWILGMLLSDSVLQWFRN